MDSDERLADGISERTLSRQEFLRRAAMLGLGLPVAGSLFGASSAFGATKALSREYAGTTLQFAKVPNVTGEDALWAQWLAPFMQQTGINVNVTIVPPAQGPALYTTTFSSNNPFDVSYQTTSDLGTYGAAGVLEDLNPYLNQWADKQYFRPTWLQRATLYNHLYGMPALLGTLLVFTNLDLLQKQGIHRFPKTMEEMTAMAKSVQSPPDIWGYYEPATVADFAWYFNIHSVHNRNGGLIGKDQKTALLTSKPVVDTVQQKANLSLVDKIQPPLGEYNRGAARSLFQAGKLLFLLDAPPMIAVFKSNPFKWNVTLPFGEPNQVVGHKGKKAIRGIRRTTFGNQGTWAMAARSSNKDAAWQLIKFLSTQQFEASMNTTLGFAPARTDAKISANPSLQANAIYANHQWEGLLLNPHLADVLNEFSKAIESAVGGRQSVSDALKTAQSNSAQILHS